MKRTGDATAVLRKPAHQRPSYFFCFLVFGWGWGAAQDSQDKGGALRGYRICLAQTERSLDRLTGGCSGGPRPLEVVSAQPAGHINHLTDKVEAGILFGLEGF